MKKKDDAEPLLWAPFERPDEEEASLEQLLRPPSASTNERKVRAPAQAAQRRPSR